MEKAAKRGLIVAGTDLHLVCKDLCTIIKGSVFEWCLCNGEMDIEAVVARIITRYLEGYLVKNDGWKKPKGAQEPEVFAEIIKKALAEQ